MNVKKLIITLQLLAFLVVPACSGKTADEMLDDTEGQEAAVVFYETGYPIVSEKITLSAFQYELDNQAIDFGNLWFYKQLEEKTNIHIEFEEIKEIFWAAKLNLMFASDNYTDLILRGDADAEEYGVLQKVLVPLDDYLEKYMPIYYSRLGMNDANAAIPASDGKSYHVGFLISQNINTNGHWFINRQWLDALGLKEPETIDELTEVLYAFKTQDPNGNGVADEIPYQATFNDTNTGIYNAFASWGVPENDYYIFIDNDEKVKFTAFTPGYRECLEWLAMLYADGILDPECISQDSNLWGAKMNNGTSGFFTYWRLQNTILNEDIYTQFENIIPVSAEGYNASVSSILELAMFGAALTVQNENIEASLRWLDAQMETEQMMVSQNGPIGDTLIINDEGKYEVSYVPENNDLYSIVPLICGQFFAPADYYSQIYSPAAHRIEKTNYCKEYEKSGVMEYKSYQYLTELTQMNSEDNMRTNKLYNEIDKFMTEKITNFVTQGVTDESWQLFIDELHDIGADEYVALYQNNYNAGGR